MVLNLNKLKSMSLLNKFIIFFSLITIPLSALTTEETPLFDPYISGKNVGLGKSTGVSSADYNNMIQNPSSIVNSTGISLHANQYMDIDYSSIIFSNRLNTISFAVQYLGSSIPNISRSVADGTYLTEIENSVPYEFHSLSIAFAKNILGIDFGGGIQFQTLILDDKTEDVVNEFIGLTFIPSKEARIGFSIQNITPKNDIENALQKKHPIYSSGASYKISNFTTAHLAFIYNENEISTHSTVHYGVEHYISKYLPIRIGVDHNRYTIGVGLNLDPFEIDIGWAESRTDVIDDQLTISFSYAFTEKKHLYKP